MTGLADSLIARLIKQRDLVRAMDDHCKTISARVTSRDHNVSVEVDGLGAMTALSLGANAHKLGPDQLAKLITDTAHAAARVAADRQKYLTEQLNTRMHELQQNTPNPLGRHHFQAGRVITSLDSLTTVRLLGPWAETYLVARA